MFYKSIPRIFSFFFKDVTFYIENSESLYLTFDDGPHPESTPYILNNLSSLNIKATFFCTGHQVQKYPELVEQIRSEGHLIGNHGFSHLNGWRTNTEKYISNFNKAKGILESNLFRPPYGKLSWRQYSHLKRKSKIILWDNMPRDFDDSLSTDKIITNFNNNLRPGSIIVLHDNPKSKLNCLAVLHSIKHTKGKSFKYETLNCLL